MIDLRIVLALSLLVAPTVGRAEDLLIVEPVYNEILGHLGSGDSGYVFWDCDGKEHSPIGLEIQKTQDTCAPGGGIITASVVDKVFSQPVYAGEMAFGTVDAITVQTAGDLAVSIKPFLADVAASQGKIARAQVDMIVTGNPGKLMLDDIGNLKWHVQ